MSFPRYPRYKDSGVEWLGEVPEHWEVRRLKRIALVWPSNVDKKSYDDETPVKLCNYTDVYYSDLITADAEFMAATASAEQTEKFTLRAGDTIITKDSETADDIAIAAYVPQDLPGVVCGYHLSMIRPRVAHAGAFIKRYFDSSFAKASVQVLANGLTRVGLTQYAVENLLVPFPPPEERAAISSFVDREVTKIDALVAEQQRLIELLKEKRQAVISHAVTRGLNPDAPMKASGVEWLGDVPAHWKVQRVKSVSDFITSGPRGWSERINEDGAIFIQSGDLDDGMRVNFDGAKRVQVEDSSEAIRTRLLSGDVVICITGAKTGNVAVCDSVHGDAYVNQHLCLIRPTADVNPKLLGFLLKSEVGQTHFSLSQYGLKQGLSLEDVREAPVVLPPADEQSSILTYIKSRLAESIALMTEAERAIALLQERRAALISAAVTGKIDVRGLAQ